MLKMKKAFLLVAVVILGANSAFALDVDEVTQLIRGGVDDEVIINMVKGQGLDRPLTSSDVMALSSAGASGKLLERMTRSEAANSVYAAPTTAVSAQPNVVYDQSYVPPAYVSPRYYNRPANYSANSGWGGWGCGGYRGGYYGGHRGGYYGGHHGGGWGGWGHRR